MVLHGASDSETRQHTHPAARRNPLAALASDDQKRMPMATTHALRPTGTVPHRPIRDDPQADDFTKPPKRRQFQLHRHTQRLVAGHLPRRGL